MKKMFYLAAIVVAGLFFVQTIIPGDIAGVSRAEEIPTKLEVARNLAAMPLAFTENRGQWDQEIKFRADAGGATMWFASDGAYYQFSRSIDTDGTSLPAFVDPNPGMNVDQSPKAATHSFESIMIKGNFVGANPNPTMFGESMMEYKCNYFIGNNKSKWATDVPNFEAVVYEELYDGIDLKYYGNGTGMEYDFLVSPGADFSQIKIQYEGTESVAINGNGELVVTTKWGEVVEQRPVIYQIENNQRIAIAGKYRMQDATSFGFEVENYNPALPLVIDPVLSYSTYLGGASTEAGYGIAVDATGAAYITGFTYSTDFPTLGPYQGVLQGAADAFVTKMNSSGNALIYSTYIGGGVRHDISTGIVVDGSGVAYICGYTFSSDFPTVNAIQDSLLGFQDAFVTKLNSSGSGLDYSTYLGGAGDDSGFGIAIDASGSAYVTGLTGSPDFPTLNPFQALLGGTGDTFVTKLSALGSMSYSTYLGGSGWEGANDIVVDVSGAAYVIGPTESLDFPTLNPYQASRQNSYDTFVTKLNPLGAGLLYSTYLGGNGYDYALDIAVDASGAAYVTGETTSIDFPMATPYQGTYQGGLRDVFVTKFSSTGSSLAFSTYLGGGAFDEALGIAVDASGFAYVSGGTYSTDFPTVAAYQATHQGGKDAFLVKFDGSGSNVVYSTFIGGSGDEGYGQCVALGTTGAAYVTGNSSSTNLPMLNPFQGSNQGGIDAFVMKFSEGSDADGDGVLDESDNCPSVTNAGQVDSDSDGVGDACDTCPGFDDLADSDSDSVADSCDVCPGFDDLMDTDLDGLPDGCDECPGTMMSAMAADLPDPQVMENLAAMPLYFTANQGQWDDKVKFRANAGGATMWFSPGGVYYQFTREVGSEDTPPSSASSRRNPMRDREPVPMETMMIKANFIGSNANPSMIGVEITDYKCNYFIGNETTKWVTDVPNYTAVSYEGIYSGIDLKYYGNGKQMEYDFIVSPGTDLSQIAIQYEGAESVTINGGGELVITTQWGEVVEQRPVIYQLRNNKRVPVEGTYRMQSDNTFGFDVRDYDASLPLVIDPVLSYSTYLGGSGADYGQSIAVAPSGSAYITGYTFSSNFPTSNPLEGTFQGGTTDVFVSKLDNIGNGLVYSTYLGGNGQDVPRGIVVDASGAAYVTGSTRSVGFPTINAYQDTYAGDGDCFIVKLSKSGSSLVYSTYLGGSAGDGGAGIVVDATGSAYVTGAVGSTDFPTVGAYQDTLLGSSDAFVAKLSCSGQSLIYSTYLGGSTPDQGASIAIDASGAAVIMGTTSSTDFPTVNAFQATYQGGGDVFVAKLSSTGSSLEYSTYLGGSGSDQGQDLAIDASGAAHVSGRTTSVDFPTVNAYQGTLAQGEDIFVTKLNSSGASLDYSTYLSGSGDDGPAYAIAVDAAGSAYITGFTNSADFPLVTPYQSTITGSYDLYVTKFSSSGTNLEYSTFFGGSGFDNSQGIAIDAYGAVYVTGNTLSSDFPTLNPYQGTRSGSNDVFVFKLSPETTTTSIGDADVGELPISHKMSQNYPNPFNPSTTISFDLPNASMVTVGIYNALGKHVRTLVNRKYAAGRYKALWDGRTTNGNQAPTGMYFYRIKTNGFTESKKMLMLK